MHSKMKIPGPPGERDKALTLSRKVRAPQGRMPGNARNGASYWTGPQKYTANKASVLLVRVKRWCKRPPAQVAISAAR